MRIRRTFPPMTRTKPPLFGVQLRQPESSFIAGNGSPIRLVPLEHPIRGRNSCLFLPTGKEMLRTDNRADLSKVFVQLRWKRRAYPSSFCNKGPSAL